MADARSDRSRSPRVPRARNPDEAAEEIPKLETHLQLLEGYMKDLRKLQACQQTLLDFSEEIAEKARSMVKEHTAKIGQNPYIFDTCWEVRVKTAESTQRTAAKQLVSLFWFVTFQKALAPQFGILMMLLC